MLPVVPTVTDMVLFFTGMSLFRIGICILLIGQLSVGTVSDTAQCEFLNYRIIIHSVAY